MNRILSFLIALMLSAGAWVADDLTLKPTFEATTETHVT